MIPPLPKSPPAAEADSMRTDSADSAQIALIEGSTEESSADASVTLYVGPLHIAMLILATALFCAGGFICGTFIGKWFSFPF